jgi:proteasome lid subunit RPN8/RPN11
MTDETLYAAVVTINIPAAGQSASVTVVLTPPDVVDVAGQVKPLADCTLADLQAFADELEADVWDAYEAITLLELDEQNTAEIEVTVMDRKGQPHSLSDIWRRQSVLFPAAPLPPTAVEPEVTETEPSRLEDKLMLENADNEGMSPVDITAPPTIPDTPSAPQVTETSLMKQNADNEGMAPVPPPPAPLLEEEPQVIVAKSEPVYAEPEETAVTSPDAAIIAPSRARVQIAGRRLPVGSRTWMAVDILLDEPAFRAAQAHALSSPNREVAGVLIGPRPEKQPDGRYVVHVFDTIIAKHTVMQGASVTYTPESWRYMNDKLAERYPDETAVMVGWYHTHPGFGIFLSGMDQFIHQNFFTQIWHVAMVLDPQGRKSGFFCWDRHKSRVSPVEFEWPTWAANSW